MADEDKGSDSAVAEIDESKVSSDIHTAPKEGGMYRTAGGSYVDAHGNVLKDEEVKRAEEVARISETKRAKEAQNAPVNTGMLGAPITQQEFDARVAAAVAAALRQQGAGSSKPARGASA